MISILSMAINTAISFCLYILKAVFSMLLWFIKAFAKVLKLFFSLLPITAIFFILFLILSLITVLSGNNSILPAHFEIGGSSFFIASKDAALPLFSALKDWWLGSIHSAKGSLSYVVLLVLTVLMFVPVTTVFLCISALSSYGQILFYAVLIDVAIYLIRSLLGKNFVEQCLDRYYFLFPDAGKKHNEKSYEKWLQRHHREFEDDSYVDPSLRKKKNFSAYYENDYDNDEDYPDDDFYEDDETDDFYEDDEADDFYEDRDDNDEEFYEDHHRHHGRYSDHEDSYGDFEDEDEDDESEDDEDFEGDYDTPAPRTTFNFFANCTDIDSLEKKYRSLAKLYHPDNMDGDTASFQEINAQYDAAKKRFLR